MTQRSTFAKWSAIVARHDGSGLSIKEFAEAEGLNPRTLGWWRWRVRQQPADADAPLAFTEVTVAPGPDEATVVVALDELHAHIVVDRQTDLALLREFLQAMS